MIESREKTIRKIIALSMFGLTSVFGSAILVIQAQRPAFLAENDHLILYGSCNPEEKFEQRPSDLFTGINPKEKLSTLIVKKGPLPRSIATLRVNQNVVIPGISDLEVSLGTADLDTDVTNTDQISGRLYCPSQIAQGMLNGAGQVFGKIADGWSAMIKS